MREVPLSTLKSMYAVDSNEYPIILIALHREGTEEDVIRLSSDPTVKLGDDPIYYGTVSRGENYIFFPFEITLPSDESDSVPRLTLSVDNVSGEIGHWLRSSTIAPTVTVEMLASSDLNAPIMTFPGFKLQSFVAGTMRIEGQITLTNLEREPYPSLCFTPSMFPGLF